MMDFHIKLPRDGKEGLLFTLIISVISVCTIAPLVSGFEAGFTADVMRHTVTILPYILAAVLVCITLVKGVAGRLSSKIIAPTDSFRAQMLSHTICTVFFMSMLMTLIGSMIAAGAVTTGPLETYLYRWPRNFAIALMVETCIAQPIARMVMSRIHVSRDMKRIPVEDVTA